MANTRGKSFSQEGERRLVESLRAARLRLFDTPTADPLRRLFGERRLVNGAPQRVRSSVEGGSTNRWRSRPQVLRVASSNSNARHCSRAGGERRLVNGVT